jgi:hypothetical protein
MNERLADIDAIGCMRSALLLSILLVFKNWISEGKPGARHHVGPAQAVAVPNSFDLAGFGCAPSLQPHRWPAPTPLRHAGLALEGSVQVAAMLWLRWLIAHRRSVYVRNREVLLGLATIHACWVGRRIGAECWACLVIGGVHLHLVPCPCWQGDSIGHSHHAAPLAPSPALAATRGGTNVFIHHGGNPLRLLGLLLACSHATWSFLFSVHSRLGHGVNCLMLPLAALLPLLTTESVCHRVVQAPGVHAPLADLHTLLSATQ